MLATTQAPPPIQLLRRSTATASGREIRPPPRLQQRIHYRCRKPPPKFNLYAGKPVGGLGQTIVVAVHSDANSQTSEEKRKREEEKQISGSDVLWALRRAAAEKKKSNAEKRKKKMMTMRDTEEPSSSTGGSTRDGRVDHRNVRPLRIKAEWGPKLEEFEKLLRELQETAI